MTRSARFLAGAATAWLACTAFALAAPQSNATPGNGATPDQQPTARDLFLQDHPQARFFELYGRITRVYGPAFGFGASAEGTAHQFVQAYSEVFGVPPTDLAPHSLLAGGFHSKGLMYDAETDTYRFTLVHFAQERDGIPVFRADLRLLVRNEADYPLVLAASMLRDLGDFAPVLPETDVAFDLGKAAVLSATPDMINFSAPRVVIWAGYDDIQPAEPVVALEFVADNGSPPNPADVRKSLYLTDALTGQIVYEESQILHVDVTGNVSAMASQSVGADICVPEAMEAMPYARVRIGTTGAFTYADAMGNFTIPNAGTAAVTVQSQIAGRWFVTFNQAAGGATTALTQTVTPPGPANFVHNQPNTSEFNRSEVNCYIEANVVRDFALAADPSYPTIATQVDFPVNVNINSTCNAYYDFSSINFYRAGGGCSNTGNTDIVHHEYGHHMVQVAGSGQGAYGEGAGDTNGVIITDQPITGIGFNNNCSTGIRSADNTMQYPCSGGSHFCGQLLSGCVWGTRNALIVNYPLTYKVILRNLWVNSIQLHGGTSIAPDITLDWLTLDDNDANINNGTPHYNEICTGFNAHNMDCPALDLIDFQYPNGLPATVQPNTQTNIAVNVVPVAGQPVAGTGTVSYRIGTTGSFTTVPMTQGLPNQYTATLPAADCLDVIQFYFRAQAQGGLFFTDPPNAPTSVFAATAASAIVTVHSDNFQFPPAGWTVSSTATDGQWDNGVPVNCNRGDPPTDFDADSTRCWLTDNSAASSCNSDVDGGSTTLTSPVFNLSATQNPIVSYARWYSNVEGGNPQQDTFVIQVSSNGGTTWSNLEVVGPTTGSPNPEVTGGWFVKTFNIGDFVPVTSQFRIRYTASDDSNGSVVEAAVDMFTIVDYQCEAPCSLPGDMDASGNVDGDDMNCYVSCLISGSPSGGCGSCACANLTVAQFVAALLN